MQTSGTFLITTSCPSELRARKAAPPAPLPRCLTSLYGPLTATVVWVESGVSVGEAAAAIGWLLEPRPSAALLLVAVVAGSSRPAAGGAAARRKFPTTAVQA
jgi:hypothetical protein